MLGKRTKRRALGLAAIFAVALLVVAGSAGAAEQYVDPSGDSGSAPDILGATVVSDQSGQLLFHLALANLPESGAVQVGLFIDSDANMLTGDIPAAGADHLMVLDQSDHSWALAQWTGSAWDWNAPDLSIKVFRVGDGFLVGVNRSDLGNTGRINFWVSTLEGPGGPGRSDEAPGDGVWNYDLQTGGPVIEDVTVQAQPASPKAGKAFTVTVTGLKLRGTGMKTDPQPESFSCTATLAGKKVAAGGANKCTFKLSKKARGKKLVVTVTVHYEGVQKSVVLSYKVK